MSETNPKVDFFFSKAGKWQEATEQLRTVIINCGLDEELKWGCPCYTYQKRNIVLIHTFKDYCALLFFKGALLNDPHGVLVQQTGNVQAARQVRFSGLMEIMEQRPILEAYIHEAIKAEESGLKVPLKKPSDFAVADEFKQKLNAIPSLKTAFEALTPGRQRNYLLHFSAPKQSKTREARVKKCIPQILDGKGLND